MLVATNKEEKLKLGKRPRMEYTTTSTIRRLSEMGGIASNSQANLLARVIYFLNGAFIISLLVVIAVRQNDERYRCKTANVLFNEEIWENALVKFDDGIIEERLLIYTCFNGKYKGKCIV